MNTNPSPNKFTSYIDKWLAHIRVLAVEIGPRGSTTAGERRGSEYCENVLRNLGMKTTLESFYSAKSIFQPHLFASIAMLIAFAIYPLSGRVSAFIAAIVSIIALISDLLELSFIENPLRWIVSKGHSQNAVATLQPSGEHIQDLILIGHVDSQRTPLVFKSPRWVGIYKAFTTIAFIAFLLQTILYFIGTITLWNWIWPVSCLSALCAVLLATMCIQADSTPFCHGANDNATAAGLVLTLAEAFIEEPLNRTRLWFVCTGCEEVQHYGAIDFFRRHLSDLVKPKCLVFEMLGCSGPSWLVKEGIVIPFYASPEMVEIAKNISKNHPDLKAYPSKISGGNTEMADALRNKVPAITLFGLTPSGEAPYWHMIEDTFDKIDPVVLARNYEFTWHFIQEIDKSVTKL